MIARLPVAALAVALSAAAAHSAAVTRCDHRTSAENLVEPWAQSTATYANGAVRIALLDTVEPAGAPFHLVVLSPPVDELGLRQCRVVSLDANGTGFFSIDFAGRRAAYDPAHGLVLTLPAKFYDPDTGDGRPGTLRVLVDQRTGAIAASMTP